MQERALTLHLSREGGYVLALSGVLLAFALTPQIAARSHRAKLKIESEPSGALVSVRHSAPTVSGEVRQVSGTTPLEKVFDFGKAGRMWVDVEKRGYAVKTVEVTPESGTLRVSLERNRTKDGSEAGEYVPGPLPKVILAEPEVRVTLRHFAKEEVSAEHGLRLGNAIVGAIRTRLPAGVDLETLFPADGLEEALARKALFRDSRMSMELLDSIRLPYLAEAPLLETRSGRNAARKLGDRSGADAILVIIGRETVETGGMKVGKVALFAAGTAASYGSAYNAAMARGDSVFVYSVYVPAFSEGLLLSAALVRCRDGEVLWINKGVWSPPNPDDPPNVLRIVEELLFGLPWQAEQPPKERREEPR